MSLFETVGVFIENSNPDMLETKSHIDLLNEHCQVQQKKDLATC